MNAGTDLTLSIILSIAEIFGFLCIGGFCRNRGYIDERDIDRWSKVVLDFLYPAFIFSSITTGFQEHRLFELWPLPLIGLGLAVGSLIVGFALRYGLRTGNRDITRTFLFCCAVNNYSYLPIVIVKNMWGDAMLANLFFLTLGSTIALWTVGVGVLGSTDIRSMSRNLLTPNLIATVAALMVAWLGWRHHIPLIVNHIIASAGSASVPMMLVLSGASLFKPPAWRIDWQVAYVTIVRLMILPACAVGVLRLLPLPPDVYAISVIVALMPLAISTVIFTRVYGGHPDFAASASLVTTLGAIFTVPLALWLLFR